MSTREKLIVTAATLFQRQGVRATGLAEILKVSGTPKGSLYYYFPKGKTELIAAAIDYAGTNIKNHVQAALASEVDPAKAIERLFSEIAAHISETGHLDNVSISLVALETTDEPSLQRACTRLFTELEAMYTAKLEASGIASEAAAALGQLIQAATEGSCTIVATKGQPEQLLVTARLLQQMIRAQLPA